MWALRFQLWHSMILRPLVHVYFTSTHWTAIHPNTGNSNKTELTLAADSARSDKARWETRNRNILKSNHLSNSHILAQENLRTMWLVCTPCLTLVFIQYETMARVIKTGSASSRMMADPHRSWRKDSDF